MRRLLVLPALLALAAPEDLERWRISGPVGDFRLFLEIAEDLPDVRTVLVPVSGGGLASGVGVAIRALCPQAGIFGVEPELAADTAEGLRLGRRDVDGRRSDRALDHLPA